MSALLAAGGVRLALRQYVPAYSDVDWTEDGLGNRINMHANRDLISLYAGRGTARSPPQADDERGTRPDHWRDDRRQL